MARKNDDFPSIDLCVVCSSFHAAMDEVASINIDLEALTRKTVSHGLKLHLCVTHKLLRAFIIDSEHQTLLNRRTMGGLAWVISRIFV